MTSQSPSHLSDSLVLWLGVSCLPGYLSKLLDCLSLIIVNTDIISLYRVTGQGEESHRSSSKFPFVLSLPHSWCGGQ